MRLPNSVLFLFLFIFCQVSFATSPKVKDAKSNDPTTLSIYLNRIKAHKISERNTDELYIDILKFSSNTRAKHYRIPHTPHHWPSTILSKLKDILLCQNHLMEGETTTFIISLLEKDAPPWDIDDLVGTVKLVVKLDKGKIKYFIGPPSAEKTSLQALGQAQIRDFSFKGPHGDYAITLKMIRGPIR